MKLLIQWDKMKLILATLHSFALIFTIVFPVSAENLKADAAELAQVIEKGLYPKSLKILQRIEDDLYEKFLKHLGTLLPEKISTLVSVGAPWIMLDEIYKSYTPPHSVAPKIEISISPYKIEGKSLLATSRGTDRCKAGSIPDMDFLRDDVQFTDINGRKGSIGVGKSLSQKNPKGSGDVILFVCVKGAEVKFRISELLDSNEAKIEILEVAKQFPFAQIEEYTKIIEE